jgi:hypothetical protein
MLFQKFQNIHRKQEQALSDPSNSPLCFSEEAVRIRNESANRGASFRFAPVFEDNNIIIKIFDRNNTDMTPAEIKAGGFHKMIFVVCKITGYGTSIFDADLADKLFEKFMRFAEEHDCVAGNFREAKSNLIKLLLSEYLYKMLFATMDTIEQIPPPQPIIEGVQDKVLCDLMDKFFSEKGLEIC